MTTIILEIVGLCYKVVNKPMRYKTGLGTWLVTASIGKLSNNGGCFALKPKL